MTLLAIILASLAESLISFLGAFAVIVRESLAKTFAHRVLGFAIGALLGVTFFDLLPEAIAGIGVEAALRWTIVGIVAFFILEKFLLWYHCHDEVCDVHAYRYLVLVGDAAHNFFDGVALALAFLVSAPLGVATTAAILLHEVPQEIADFGLLIRGGYSRLRALWYNFLISLSTILGALLTYALGASFTSFLPYALAIIAGNFLYLALSDLLPETHERTDAGHFIGQAGLMVAGLLLMYAIGAYLPE